MIHKRIFTESVCDEEIYFMVVDEEVSCQVLPQGIWYISGEYRLDCLLGLMLGSDHAIQGQPVYGAVDRISLHSSSNYI